MNRNLVDGTLKQARKLVVAVVGGTVLVIGLAMTVLPGPAIVVIPVGLAILATEFVWARKLLHRIKHGAEQMASKVRRNKADQGPPEGRGAKP